MNDYFPQDNGIGVRIGNGVKQVLQIIANRFIADNPPIPVKYYLSKLFGRLLQIYGNFRFGKEFTQIHL